MKLPVVKGYSEGWKGYGGGGGCGWVFVGVCGGGGWLIWKAQTEKTLGSDLKKLRFGQKVNTGFNSNIEKAAENVRGGLIQQLGRKKR